MKHQPSGEAREEARTPRCSWVCSEHPRSSQPCETFAFLASRDNAFLPRLQEQHLCRQITSDELAARGTGQTPPRCHVASSSSLSSRALLLHTCRVRSARDAQHGPFGGQPSSCHTRRFSPQMKMRSFRAWHDSCGAAPSAGTAEVPGMQLHLQPLPKRSSHPAGRAPQPRCFPVFTAMLKH